MQRPHPTCIFHLFPASPYCFYSIWQVILDLWSYLGSSSCFALPWIKQQIVALPLWSWGILGTPPHTQAPDCPHRWNGITDHHSLWRGSQDTRGEPLSPMRHTHWGDRKPAVIAVKIISVPATFLRPANFGGLGWGDSNRKEMLLTFLPLEEKGQVGKFWVIQLIRYVHFFSGSLAWLSTGTMFCCRQISKCNREKRGKIVHIVAEKNERFHWKPGGISEPM